MGGHGGLNILPQKKWNVYNKDNRDIVERDKRIAREKEQSRQHQEHKNQAKNRIQQLKKQRDNVSQTPSSHSRSPSQEKPKQSETNAQLKEILEAKQNINLFKEEEQYLLQKQNTQARIELEKEFFKDKPFDLSTKFLGSLDQDKPWYAKQRIDQNQSQVQQNVREQLKQFKNDKDSYYKILDLSKKYQEETLISEIEAKKEEKIEENIDEKQLKKEEKKKKKQLQKLGEELKKLLGSDDSELERKREKQKKIEKDQLRRERIQREKVERTREQKLMSSVYQFKE